MPPCSPGSVIVTGPVNSVAASPERLAVTCVVPTVASISRVRGPRVSLVMATSPVETLQPRAQVQRTSQLDVQLVGSERQDTAGRSAAPGVLFVGFTSPAASTAPYTLASSGEPLTEVVTKMAGSAPPAATVDAFVQVVDDAGSTSHVQPAPVAEDTD